jgi:AcrR family transcriptional regulator
LRISAWPFGNSRVSSAASKRRGSRRGIRVASLSSARHRHILIAERLVQTRGYNGFSYADVAAELNISKASLHYHFPGKAELGEALIRRYAVRPWRFL